MNPSDQPPQPQSLAVALGQQRRAQRNRLLALLTITPLVLLLIGFAVTITRGVGVSVSPTDAVASALIELTAGVGIIVGGDVYALSSEVGVVVSSPGFFPKHLSISPKASSSYVAVELEPKPARLQIGLASDGLSPDESIQNATNWFIDDVWVHEGSVLETSLPAGDYRITADNAYFDLRQQTLSLERGQAYRGELALERIKGELRMQSQPSGAQVLISGQPITLSDAVIALPGGEYEVEVTLENHASVVDKIQITRDQQSVRRDYRLVSNPGFVDVSVASNQGRLLLNGKSIAVRAQRLSLAPNTNHVLVYERPGFHTRTEALRLKAGEVQQISLDLKEDVGKVVVNSEPPAAVSVNGRQVGMSPITLHLPAVAQTLVLTRAGYHTETREVLPSDAAEQLVAVNLVTERDYRLATMPRVITNDVDMVLQQFRPNEVFQLGAPRSEKGQRANESLRQARLTKAFYVSQTEVTKAQYAHFSGTLAGVPNHPQTGISWTEAARFCNWLSEREQLKPVYQFRNGRFVSSNIASDGYRLPTEAEWEWLARKAGRRSSQRFVWGNDYTVPAGSGNLADEQARAQVDFYIPQYTDGYPGLAPVASFGADSVGLFDMVGNVSEWVHDYYVIEPVSLASLNPVGPKQGEGRVVKGSSWRSGTASQLRASYRDGATQPRDDLGFRIVRYLYGEDLP